MLQMRWQCLACEHEGSLPCENPAEFLAGFSCRGSTFSQLSPLVSSNPWACAKRMGATIIPEGKIQSHASLQSSEDRPQSAMTQQKKTHDHIGNSGKDWMIFSNQLTQDRCINHRPNFPKCWSTKKLLINKKIYQFFLINKISNVETHQNVDQQKK